MSNFEIAVGVEGLSRAALQGTPRGDLKETRVVAIRPKPHAETIFDSIVQLATEKGIEVDLINLEDSTEVLFEEADSEDRLSVDDLIGGVSRAITDFNPANRVTVLPDVVKLRDQRSVFEHIGKSNKAA